MIARTLTGRIFRKHGGSDSPSVNSTACGAGPAVWAVARRPHAPIQKFRVEERKAGRGQQGPSVSWDIPIPARANWELKSVVTHWHCDCDGFSICLSVATARGKRTGEELETGRASPVVASSLSPSS